MAAALNSRLSVEYFEPNSAEHAIRSSCAEAGKRRDRGADFWRDASPRHRAMLRDVSANLDDREVAFAHAWHLSCETGVSPSDLMRHAAQGAASGHRFSAMGVTAVALVAVITPFLF